MDLSLPFLLSHPRMWMGMDWNQLSLVREERIAYWCHDQCFHPETLADDDPLVTHDHHHHR